MLSIAVSTTKNDAKKTISLSLLKTDKLIFLTKRVWSVQQEHTNHRHQCTVDKLHSKNIQDEIYGRQLALLVHLLVHCIVGKPHRIAGNSHLDKITDRPFQSTSSTTVHRTEHNGSIQCASLVQAQKSHDHARDHSGNWRIAVILLCYSTPMAAAIPTRFSSAHAHLNMRNNTPRENKRQLAKPKYKSLLHE